VYMRANPVLHFFQGGRNWSNSFSKTSNRAFNWSRGAHGLRHTYAQERMKEIRGIKTSLINPPLPTTV
jgi:hypothetical protein